MKHIKFMLLDFLVCWATRGRKHLDFDEYFGLPKRPRWPEGIPEPVNPFLGNNYIESTHPQASKGEK